MSRSIGQFVIRFRFVILAVWILASIWMATQAPSLKEVAVSETSEFLPAKAPSQQAAAAIAKAFPTEGNQGSAIVVVSRPGGLTDADNAYSRSLSEWLASPDAPAVTEDVASLFSSPGTESLFLSPDHSTMLMSVGFSSAPMDDLTVAAIDAIRSHIASSAPPQGLEVHLTGASPISSDERTALFTGVDRTALVTILLVITILLIIYRSPVAALAPLMTIGMAYLVSRGVLGYLAVAGWKISSFVDAFIVVIIFGAGTDYCLFLLSRFREELGRRTDRNEAIVVTVSAIGAVITASASTVIVALVFMATGEFIMLQTMGPAMALCVFITLVAGLTLTPSLIAIFGRYLFWPRHDEISHESGKNWQRVAEIATTRYHLVMPIVVAILLIPYLALPHLHRMFDILGELPKQTDSVLGFKALSKGFDPGELLPVTVLLTDPQGDILDDANKIDQVTTALQAAPEVQRIRSVLQPTGDPQTTAMFHVDAQLKQASDGLNQLINSLDNPQAMASQESGSQQQGGTGTLTAFLTDLGRVPAVASDPAYGEVMSRSQALDAGMARLAEASKLSSQLDGVANQMSSLAQSIKAGNATSGSSSSSSTGDLGNLTTYLTQMGQAFPSLANQPAFQDAMLAVPALVSDITSAQQMMLVTNQLALLAKELQTLSTSLNTPLGALALTSSGASSQQLALLSGYFADLGKAFPTITSDASYQSILSHLAKLDDMSRQMTSNPPSDLTAALAALKAEVDGIAADTLALQKTFAAQTPPAQFVPQDLAALSALQTGAAAAPDPAKSAQRLADDLTALTAFAKAQLPDATFRPTGIPLSESVRRSLAQLKEDTTSLQAALNRLAADTSKGTPIDFVPKSFLSDPKTSSLLSHFVSADGQSTQLTVVLKATPYSVQANRDVESLLPRVQDAAKAAGLQAVMGGAPVVLDDVEVIMSTDFMRIAVLTLVGVLIVLILLLRSLVAPIYLVLTVLLSYGSTIGVSTIVFQYVLQQEGVNYIIPIIVFVLLVALGADYNIFLMSRVREESEGRGTREGIRIASAYTGSIITSCGIILAGTFAAMMVAPIQTLFQVGFAVAAGVLVDTFVIRAVLVPAIAATLGERNWWPSRIKPKA